MVAKVKDNKKGASRRKNVTRVSRKNQVTLPVAVLAKAHVKPGDRLMVEASGDGRIVLAREHDPLEDFIGAVPGLSRATNLEALRDEWER